jgi:hypothetical protein
MQLYHATIKNGKLEFENEKYLNYYLKNNEGIRVSIKIQKAYRQRSVNQNNLYWLYLTIIENETGDNANDLHEYFKRALLTPDFIKVRGKQYKIPKSTSRLNKLEFGEYINKIERLTGIPVPDPNAL